MYLRISLLIGLMTLNHGSYAMDLNNKFTVKGAGAVSCQQYVEAVKGNNDKLIAFSGWVDGYLSFHNEISEETFDIAPWQSTKLLSKALYSHCNKKPKLTFFAAVKYMIQALQENRLKEASGLVKVKVGNQSLYFYQSILINAQVELSKKLSRSLSTDGKFSEEMQRALLTYQKLQKINESGLPDQDTLQRLFSKPRPNKAG